MRKDGRRISIWLTAEWEVRLVFESDNAADVAITLPAKDALQLARRMSNAARELLAEQRVCNAEGGDA